MSTHFCKVFFIFFKLSLVECVHENTFSGEEVLQLSTACSFFEITHYIFDFRLLNEVAMHLFEAHVEQVLLSDLLVFIVQVNKEVFGNNLPVCY